MGYSNDDSMVRVDFFKESGKWGYTEAVKWTGAWLGDIERGQLIHEAFAISLRNHFRSDGRPDRLSDFDAVCIHPYHQHAHPIILKKGAWLNTIEYPDPIPF